MRIPIDLWHIDAMIVYRQLGVSHPRTYADFKATIFHDLSEF